MLKFILKRIFWFIPSFVVLTMLGFLLVSLLPSPCTLSEEELQKGVKASDKQAKCHELGWDLPLFYFKMASFSEPDTLYKILDPSERKACEALLRQFGNWEAIEGFRQSVNYMRLNHQNFKLDSSFQDSAFQQNLLFSLNQVQKLKYLSEEKEILHLCDTLSDLYTKNKGLQFLESDLLRTHASYLNLKTQSTTWKNFLPSFIYYGTKNQYHLWIRGILQGNWGKSFYTGKPVFTQMLGYLGRSSMLMLLALVLGLAISLPLGLAMANAKGSRWERGVRYALLGLDAIPAFWMAVLLLTFFANPAHLAWFMPAVNLGGTVLGRYTLPLICYLYGFVVLFTRQMQASAQDVLRTDYVRTAFAKGLSTHRVLFIHVLKNAALPLIAIVAAYIPALLGGSILLENIFGIYGMGYITFTALLPNDPPLLLAIFLSSGFLSALSLLFADVLSKYLDKRFL